MLKRQFYITDHIQYNGDLYYELKHLFVNFVLNVELLVCGVLLSGFR